MPDSELELMTKISLLYYKQDLNQREIAKKLGISRPKVSRLLNRAIKEGIVRIEIISPVKDTSDLESDIEIKYGLREVLIVDNIDNQPEDLIKIKIGKKCEEYIDRVTKGNEYIGVSAGTTLYKLAEHVKLDTFKEFKYVPLIGSLSDVGRSYNSNEICSLLSSKLGGTNYILNAPALVKSEKIAKAFKEEVRIQKIIMLYEKLDIAILGIGIANKSHPLYNGHLIPEEEKKLDNYSLCGSIGVIMYNRDGEILTTPFSDRTIGIKAEQLLMVPIRIGLAAGKEKGEAILGAIRSKLVNVLITDWGTGQWLNQI